MQHDDDASPDHASTTIRPRSALLRQLALATLALVVPLGAALLVLAIPTGNAAAVIVGVVVVALLGALLAGLYLTSYVRITHATGDVESRFLGRRTRVRRGAVHDLLVVHVYQGLTLDTQPRLFVMDADGRLLLRLSGHVYDLWTMRSMAADLDLPLTEQARVLTMAELRGARRGVLPWYERSRVALAGALVLLGVAVIGAVVGIMALTGVPVSIRL
ncbi:hypothetical protein [Clavibacter phaseoli]|uniref:hypothetical protein n=1 Tax=Clavibacter phaseoli TaxID=1734031 RepID=UPI000E6663BA|nr:hypothetical protein [Clavibacter phaseoli]MBM7389120.1 hypothetical protein [Clavibacter michiganensis]RIJ54095.1 hypothetical protein DZF99_13115 [Clavibacter phaseoli]RIJ60800.1 hypothetical protein DZG03_00830 [Clavibacter phaseoli]UKF31269.1 hypothetical protein FGD69_09495 [Clavibacter phaseoli]UKF37188.1 hypothetical protein FGI33_08875 [Clavibacter phaseoli]